MRVRADDGWLDGFLAYSGTPADIAITVTHWVTLGRVEGLYFERPPSGRMVWNYFREIGFTEVVKKIRSRRSERLRNVKCLSVGKGWFVQGGEARACYFIAFAHPVAVDTLVLPRVAVLSCHRASKPEEAQLRWIDRRGGELPDALAVVAGWSPHAGIDLPEAAWATARETAQRLVDAEDWTGAEAVPVASENSPTSDGVGKGRAAVYGLGNYAKLYILPHIKARLQVDRIAEIDPLQIPRDRGHQIDWTTNAFPNPQDRFDVYFVAGFHHTHAPIAAHALSHGAVAVVEKPLAVDQQQLNQLVEAMRTGGGRLFAGYHKRYSELTVKAREDLAAPAGAPIDYHCIVYEVPLPPRHWYRWPNSHSRILSNGCHWIDHFLFLNGFAEPTTIDVVADPMGTINCTMTLSNGACFTMVLTEHGSERLGMREQIELRHGDVTVRIVDGGHYVAENSQRVLRRARANKADSYRDMYAAITQAIVEGESGDSLASLEVGAQAIVDVEAALIRRYPEQFAAFDAQPRSLSADRQGHSERQVS